MATDPVEFNAIPVPPSTDAPLSDGELEDALKALAPGRRIEDAIAQLNAAAFSIGFAKHAAPRLQTAGDNFGKTPVNSALSHVVQSLLQKAVVDTAATFDQTGEGSSSLPTALNLITRQIKFAPGSLERTAALKLVSEIRTKAIEEKSSEIAYVRHMRNKWAAHASLDIAVDPWKPGKTLDLDKLETALHQMKEHFHELVLLAEQVTALKDVESSARRIDAKTFAVGIDWKTFSNQSIGWMESIGENSARLFLEQLSPSLTPEDR